MHIMHGGCKIRPLISMEHDEMVVTAMGSWGALLVSAGLRSYEVHRTPGVGCQCTLWQSVRPLYFSSRGCLGLSASGSSGMLLTPVVLRSRACIFSEGPREPWRRSLRNRFSRLCGRYWGGGSPTTGELSYHVLDGIIKDTWSPFKGVV